MAVPLDRFDVPGFDDDEADDDPAIVPEPPIEPGDPEPENVIFVLLGVLIAIAVIARLFVLFA